MIAGTAPDPRCPSDHQYWQRPHLALARRNTLFDFVRKKVVVIDCCSAGAAAAGSSLPGYNIVLQRVDMDSTLGSCQHRGSVEVGLPVWEQDCGPLVPSASATGVSCEVLDGNGITSHAPVKCQLRRSRYTGSGPCVGDPLHLLQAPLLRSISSHTQMGFITDLSFVGPPLEKWRP